MVVVDSTRGKTWWFAFQKQHNRGYHREGGVLAREDLSLVNVGTNNSERELQLP